VAGFKDDFGPAPIDVRHVATTNAFRAPDGDNPEIFCRRLLDELEQTILEAGPEEVALIIAEPVQNAGGCIVAPPGYWPGLRQLADRYGALLMADEVITGFGRIAEWFGISREGVVPDLISLAKGLTSAYASMGAVLARPQVVEPLITAGRSFRHGVTFGGHPLSAAVALKNIEIFERDRVLDNVRALEGHLQRRLEGLRELPIVGDVRGAGFFWAVELIKDERNTRFDKGERDRLLRGYLPRRLREVGMIARLDDRGDSVFHIAPPLISDRAVLDEIVDLMADVLTGAAAYMGLSRAA
jgi:adenosylmethionine-8-amino-7-oxononanoate aminotransferase